MSLLEEMAVKATEVENTNGKSCVVDPKTGIAKEPVGDLTHMLREILSNRKKDTKYIVVIRWWKSHMDGSQIDKFNKIVECAGTAKDVLLETNGHNHLYGFGEYDEVCNGDNPLLMFQEFYGNRKVNKFFSGDRIVRHDRMQFQKVLAWHDKEFNIFIEIDGDLSTIIPMILPLITKDRNTGRILDVRIFGIDGSEISARGYGTHTVSEHSIIVESNVHNVPVIVNDINEIIESGSNVNIDILSEGSIGSSEQIIKNIRFTDDGLCELELESGSIQPITDIKSISLCNG